MEKYRNKYRIPSTRLQHYDYGSQGLYFITICTKNHIRFFGDIVDTGNGPSLRPTTIGRIAMEYWKEIPHHYPYVILDEYVVMPDHMHGILAFNTPNKVDWTPNRFGPQSQNLGAVIRGFKSTTKRYANLNHIEFEWQGRYYDRIIRDEMELNAIRNYVIRNPEKWMQDRRGR